MGKYVNGGKVILPEKVDYDDAVREIASLLRVGARPDGKHRLADLFLSKHMSKWAKCKPFVKVNQSTRFDKATYEERRLADFGLSIPYATSPDLLVSRYYNAGDKDNGWDRQRPRGERYKEPLRLFDFNGYFHNAVCPFREISFPSRATNKAGRKITVTMLTSEAGQESDSIKMKDIDTIADCYLTLQLKHEDFGSGLMGTYIRTISSDSKLKDNGGETVEASIENLPTGNWTIVPFFSQQKYGVEQDGSQIPASSRYYPIPRIVVGIMELADTDYKALRFQGYKSAVNVINPIYSVIYNFMIYNYSANDKTFDNIIVQARYAGMNKDIVTNLDTEGGEVQVVLSGITVPKGGAKDAAQSLDDPWAIKWLTMNIGEALYNSASGIEILIQLDRGEPTFRHTIKTTATGAPEYNPDMDAPIIPIEE